MFPAHVPNLSAEEADRDRAQCLAKALDFFTEADLCTLCNITPATAEAWRKRHKGPAYALAGNRVLYPKSAVQEFLMGQVRQLKSIAARSLL